ncbi:MAG: hypothetical protein ABR600_06420, partial [Actinomycetota bacterium]
MAAVQLAGRDQYIDSVGCNGSKDGYAWLGYLKSDHGNDEGSVMLQYFWQSEDWEQYAFDGATKQCYLVPSNLHAAVATNQSPAGVNVFRVAYANNRVTGWINPPGDAVDTFVLGRTGFDPASGDHAWQTPWYPEWGGQTTHPETNMPGTLADPVSF